VPVPNVPMPPEPANAMTVDGLIKVKPLSVESFALEQVVAETSADRTIQLVIDGNHPPNTRRLCVIDSATARCAPPPEKVAAMGALQLLGTSEEGAPPLLFTGKRGGGGIFRGDDGERLDAMTTFGAFVRRDRSAFVLGPLPPPAAKEMGNLESEPDAEKPAKKEPADEKKPKTTRLRLVHFTKTGAPVTTVLPLPEGADPKMHTASLLWDWVLWKTLQDGQAHLLAQPLRPDGSLGPVVHVGAAERETIEFPEVAPAIEGCRTSSGMVVRLRSASGYLAFLGKDGWKAPVPTAGRGSMTCTAGATGPEATVTTARVQERAATFRLGVDQELCTPSGCAFAKGTVSMSGDLAPPDRGRIGAVGLDGKVLLVWAGGTRGGVRMRLAKAMDLAQAPDTVLFDDQVAEGKLMQKSSLYDLLLIGRDGYAVLLLSTTAGVHVLRIDKGGGVTPLSVQ
jgi:hypothetical protein